MDLNFKCFQLFGVKNLRGKSYKLLQNWNRIVLKQNFPNLWGASNSNETKTTSIWLCFSVWPDLSIKCNKYSGFPKIIDKMTHGYKM